MDHYFLTLMNGGGPLCTVQRLKAQCDEALSNVAFKLNLRPYAKVPALREFVHERTLKRRRVTLRAHVEALVRFGDQASGLLTTSI
jgi:hypothetical protein